MSTPAEIASALRRIVGRRHTLVGSRATRPYCSGYRFGNGSAVAVVRPGSLVELWRVTKLCVAADAIIIMQAANTGLTGGSTPDGEDYDRPVVLVSTTRLTGIQLLDGGRQVVCLPGARLHDLERRLRPWGREPHSVIGSSCIGASVVGGVCNNSGGALVRRGPAYTELALYGQLGADGELRLVNELGIDLGSDPETILDRLERGAYAPCAVQHDPARTASDVDYCRHVRDLEAPTPARFNADARRLRGAAGSAGRIIVFAVRLDTFAADKETAVFYLGTSDPDELAAIRRDILGKFADLPVAAEYMHRDAFDLATRYGKDIFYLIRWLGAARLPWLFRAKRRLDQLARALRMGGSASERLLQGVSRMLPSPLPPKMAEFGGKYEHHLLLKMAGAGIAEARQYLRSRFPGDSGDYYECSSREAEYAFLHRFVVASAAIRFRAVHPRSVADIISIDVAMPRNTNDWRDHPPINQKDSFVHKIYYGHFLCHVFHWDYLVKKGRNVATLETELLNGLDARGAEYPAEHNVGHIYHANAELVDFYRRLDPTNTFNPGIGITSKSYRWVDH